MDYILGYLEVLPDAGKLYLGIIFLALFIIVVGLASFTVSHFRSANRKHRTSEATVPHGAVPS
jgi:hypothetical protein